MRGGSQRCRREPRSIQPSAPRGTTRVELAQALEGSFGGHVVGFYREPGSAGTGVYPQETRLLPIIARPPLAEREDVSVINSLQIWGPVAGRMIPMNQVTSGAEVVWEDPIVMRRDRFPTLTVHADPRSRLPGLLFNRMRAKIEQIELPPRLLARMGGIMGIPETPAPPWPSLCPTYWG